MPSITTLSRRLLVVLVAALVLSAPSRAERTTGDTGEPSAATAQLATKSYAGKAQTANCTPGSARVFIDINNAIGPLYNIGALFWRSSGDFLYEIPAGSGLHSIFATGLWVGGLYNGVATDLRFAGSTYGPFEFWPGPLGTDGDITQAECATFDQFWKVNKQDIINFRTGEGEVVNEVSLRTWPIAQGAPFYVDANENDQRDPDTEPVIELDVNDSGYSTTLGGGRQINLDAGERPDIVGDQGIWWVMNDVGNTHGWSAKPPLGIEIRVLAFAFNTADALNNTTFYRYELFYRNTLPMRNTFIGYFSDPDLGDYTDDYVGSDIDLGLGFVYNGDANDAVNLAGYGALPPALGYDYFQGPLVGDGPGSRYNDGIDNDGDGQTDEEDERLQVDTFFYFTNDSGPTTDPAATDDRGLVAYQYMRGIWKDGVPMTVGGDGYNPGSADVTRFAFPGDPPSFWSEYNVDGRGTSTTPADRRFGIASGPFTLNPGDKQEIVFGIVWSQAPDACRATATPQIASLQQLKFDDITVQGAFNADFVLPQPPSALEVTATPLDQEIILEFEPQNGTLQELFNYEVDSPFADVTAPDETYNFEGIRIIQFRDETDQSGTVIATFDLNNSVTTVVDSRLDCSTGAVVTGVVASGNNSGTESTVPTTIRIQNDAFRSGAPLRNNTTYYFGVQPYAYNEFSSPQRIFNAPLTRVSARPSIVAARNDGTVLNAQATDVLTSTASPTTSGEGVITATVNNPAALTGQDYRVEFFTQLDDDGNPALDENGQRQVNYRIVNAETNEVILDGDQFFRRFGRVLDQTDNVASADGLTFSVRGPAPGFSSFALVANATGPIDPAPGSAAFGSYPTPGGDNPSTDLQADGTRWMINYLDELFGGSGAGSYQAFLDNIVDVNEALPYSFEIRFTESGSTGFAGFGINQPIELPFELWNIGIGSPDDTSDDAQCFALVVDQDWVAQGQQTEFNLLTDASATSTFGFASDGDSALSSAANDPYTDSFVWECPTVADGPPTPGTGYYDSQVAGTTPEGATGEPFGFMTFVAWNLGSTAAGAYSDDELPETGSVFRISSFVPNQPLDSYTISTADVQATTADLDTRESALDLITITPNPYRGVSGYETSGTENIARLVNLPANATIRIYTLSGTLVRTLNKANDGNTTLDWNLRTEAGLPAASGIYLIHIEARTADNEVIGERILKFGLVQRRIQLDFV